MPKHRSIAIATLVLLATAVMLFRLTDESGDSALTSDSAARTDDFASDSITVAVDRNVLDARREVSVDEDRSTATLATIILQVEEIDRCIDPRGSRLILRDHRSGSTRESSLGEEGGALFESIPIDPAGNEFEILTGIADRRCFPSSFTVFPIDLEGDPKSFALSVALIHDHVLTGTVFDATRSWVSDATLEVDSFANTTARSDHEGRFRLVLPEPRGSIVIRAPGYQELWWSFPESREDRTSWLPSERDFELVRDPLLSIVEIEATFADGSPASNARLSVLEGSDVAYAEALRSFTSVAHRDRYLERLSNDIDAIGRVTTEDGSVPTQLDEHGRATLRFALPCAARLIVSSRDEMAAKEILLAPGDRTRVALRLAPAASLDIGLAQGNSKFVGSVLVVEKGEFRGLAYILTDRSRVALERLPPDTDLILIVTGSMRIDGEPRAFRARTHVRTRTDSTPMRVDLVLESAPEPPIDAARDAVSLPDDSSRFDLLVRIVSGSSGEFPEQVAVELRGVEGSRFSDAKRDFSGVLTTSFPRVTRNGSVSARRGLLGDIATIESNVVTLDLKPLRRVRVAVVDRATGDPVDATVRGAYDSRSGRGSLEALVPCGQTSTIEVRAFGYETAFIPVGDGDGIPRLLVPLDR